VTTPYEIPLTPAPQRFSIELNGVNYNLRIVWNTIAGVWVLDIADTDNVPLVQGIPLVTGADLLEQYQHLNFGGGIVVLTDANPDAVPTIENLGSSGRVYFVVV